VKVLLLEDDARLAAVILRGLRRAGHQVEVATSIAEASWSMSETVHSVYILDVMLPDGNGFELCRQIRARGDWTPVLMLTARDAVDDRVRGLDVGADDYLVKPFAFAELGARLRALDRRGPATHSTTVVAGSLTIDPAAHEVTIAGRSLPVTPRQFALLELFAKRHDEVLTRAVILDEIWDWAFEGDPRIVDVYVAALRRLLARHPDAPAIETIRGVGYVLRPGPASAIA
jgi:DNA-binding response OmpR family regulator